jgi:hypothetical protein
LGGGGVGGGGVVGGVVVATAVAVVLGRIAMMTCLARTSWMLTR